MAKYKWYKHKNTRLYGDIRGLSTSSVFIDEMPSSAGQIFYNAEAGLQVMGHDGNLWQIGTADASEALTLEMLRVARDHVIDSFGRV